MNYIPAFISIMGFQYNGEGEKSNTYSIILFIKFKNKAKQYIV